MSYVLAVFIEIRLSTYISNGVFKLGNLDKELGDIFAIVGGIMNLYRKAFVFSYLTRGRYRTSRRSMDKVLRLGILARELTKYYLLIVYWEKFDRILRISI